MQVENEGSEFQRLLFELGGKSDAVSGGILSRVCVEKPGFRCLTKAAFLTSSHFPRSPIKPLDHLPQ
jgi:hypothetical protein